MFNQDESKVVQSELQDVVQEEIREVEFQLDRLQKRRDALSLLKQAVIETEPIKTRVTPLKFYPAIVIEGGRRKLKTERAVAPCKLRLVAG